MPSHPAAVPQDWIPRLNASQMPEALAGYLGSRVNRLGYLGEMFQVGANSPDVLLSFMQFTDALKEALPFDIGETTVLTVADLADNAYERNQHERLCMRSGLDRAWIASVHQLEPDTAALLTPEQRATQRYAMRAVGNTGHAASAEFGALAAYFSPAQAMSIAFLVGRYLTHALIVNTLQLQPPVPSIFDDGFDG